MNKIIIKSFDGFELSAIFNKVADPKAVVLLVHGSLEHKERYLDFVKFLGENGYASLIADLRGHGHSVDDIYSRGYMDGFENVVKDLHCEIEYIQKHYPGKPIYMFAHSLGTLFARIFLQDHDEEIQKLVLSGTVKYNPGVGVGIALAKTIIFFRGKERKSQLLNNMAAIKKDNSWLSYNKANLKSYSEDKLNTPRWQNAGALTVFESDRELKNLKRFHCKNPELEILLVSGKDDVITGGEKGLASSINLLSKAGYDRVQNKVYPNMKHEILNELDNKIVYDDILNFFDN